MTEIEQLQADVAKAEADFKAANEEKKNALDELMDAIAAEAREEVYREASERNASEKKCTAEVNFENKDANRDYAKGKFTVATRALAVARDAACADRDAFVAEAEAVYAAELKWLPPTPTVEQID